MLIEPLSADDSGLAALFAAQQYELRGTILSAHDEVNYLVAVVGERVVACGGWQPLGPGVAEIKRMYVRPAFRGRGIAGQLVVALEEEALAADRPVLRLETGTYLPAALALCRSAGYERIPAFGEYAGDPYSVCFEKSLMPVISR